MLNYDLLRRWVQLNFDFAPDAQLGAAFLQWAAMFFSFDGVDGVGKTTQMDLFCDWLRGRGQDVVTCRDPGSTALGEALRTILLGRHDLAIDRRSEMLIYMAAQVQMFHDADFCRGAFVGLR